MAEKQLQHFIIKVKDRDQDMTHTIEQWAYSKNEANVLAIQLLRKLGLKDLEIV